MPYPDAVKPWRPADDAVLVDELGHGGSIEAIAAKLKRSPAEVHARLDALADPPDSIFPRDVAAT